MKKLALVLLTLMMLFAVAGCTKEQGGNEGGNEQEGGNAEPEKTTPIIYYVAPRSGGLAWNQSKEGFDAACKELGVEAYFLAPAEVFNVPQQIDLASTALNSGAEALICAPGDLDLWGATIEECHSKGVVVATIATPVDYADINVGATYEDRAKEYLNQLEKLCDPNEELNILYLATGAGQQTDAMLATFENWCAERGNAKVVTMDFVNGDPVQGNDKMSSNLSAYPEINAVICPDAGGSVGVGSYINENNRQDLYVVVEANTPDVINYILIGALDVSVNWEYYDYGYEAVRLLVDNYQGKHVEKFNNPAPSVITAENGEEYAKAHNIDLGSN